MVYVEGDAVYCKSDVEHTDTVWAKVDLFLVFNVVVYIINT